MTGQTSDTRTDFLLTQLREHDADRYFASLMVPEDVRGNVIALYCFHGELAKTAETVSEAMLGEIRLQWWREALDLIADGHVREHPVVEGLSRLEMSTDLRAELDRMIEARLVDLDADGPQSKAAFRDYLDGTGGALMRAAAHITGLAPAEINVLGKVGYLHALTGVLRALEFHAGLGQSSLPEQGEISPKSLSDEDIAALRPVLQELLDEGEAILSEVRDCWPELSTKGKGVASVAFYVRPILAALRAAELDPRGLANKLSSDFSRLKRLAIAFLPWGRP